MSDTKKGEANVSKPNKTLVQVKAFYNKHLPTDRKTYNLRIPFVGIILSALTFNFVTTFIAKLFFRNQYNNLVEYCYVFAAAGVAYELYYGLKTGDRKQYTPWILLKIIEICMSIVAIIYGCYDHRRYLSSIGDIMVYGSIVLVLNAAVTCFVVVKSVRSSRRPPPRIDEFDTCDDV